MSDDPSSPEQFTRVSPASAGALHLRMPDGSAFQFPLLSSTMTVGRAPECDLVLEHVTVSRQHARITVEQGRLFLEDLGSSNGTYMDERKLEPGQRLEIHPDQVLEFGQVRAVFQRAVVAAPVTSYPISTPVPSGGGLQSFMARFSPTTRLVLLAGGVIILLAIVFSCLAIAASTLLARRQTGRLTAFCEQSPMLVFTQGGSLFTASAVSTAFPSNPQLAESLASASQGESSASPQPILTTAFLDLPFPYDGGNENFGGTPEQFRLAIQRNVGTGGRVNSFFDHFLPLYPAPADPGSPGGKEPAEKPIAQNIVPFDGLLNPYYAYSGHPALDFSTFVYRQPTTPVFAAADGVIAAAGTHGASGALYVKINHTVQDVGTFQTVYWHLHPDEFFDAMLGREGEPVAAGDRVGTMGNTGFSTGHHLHFEVRFDLNQDGNFSGTEVVDPFGWYPSAEYQVDPWFQSAGMVSNYLWTFPLGNVAQVPADGGGQLAQPGDTGGEYPVSVCAQPGTFPPGGTVSYSWAPDPNPTTDTLGVGQGCVLSVFDEQGQPVTQFNAPVKIVLPFNQLDLSKVDLQTLTIYWKAPDAEEWQALPTTLDLDAQVAIAETSQPGKCSLLGLPLADYLPPVTTVQLSGDKAPDGSFYDEVLVTLLSDDPSGIQEILYSLDNGTSWQTYSAPFSLQPGPIPQPVLMDEEFFGGPPGTFVILASSVDGEGNIEDPPVMMNFSIDASKNPDQPAATYTPTATATTTATTTATATATLATTLTPTASATPACKATFTLTKNANCRKGPGTVYDVFTSYLAGEAFPIEGRSADGTWFWISAPSPAGAHCWLSNSVGAASSETTCQPVIAAPPTPTPKPVDTTPPGPPTLLRPPDNMQFSCNSQVPLAWSEVSDPSGIQEYQWVLEYMLASTETFAVESSGSTSSTNVNVNLNGCYYYRWTVRAVDGAGNIGPYAPYFSFFNTGG